MRNKPHTTIMAIPFAVVGLREAQLAWCARVHHDLATGEQRRAMVKWSELELGNRGPRARFENDRIVLAENIDRRALWTPLQPYAERRRETVTERPDRVPSCRRRFKLHSRSRSLVVGAIGSQIADR